tara:strand:+ start:12623 stop:13528 length:906 start_codon:yes stop_codon:yes gene_type:complete
MNFVIIGAGGYIAERHFKSIKNTNNKLVAACDINDSVGLLDKYFPECKFFKNLTSLYKFIIEFKEKIDFLVVCTPNHLHYKHIKFGLENNINVICEKPTVLFPNQIFKLKNLELKYKKKVYTILQLRLQKELIDFKKYFLNKKLIHKKGNFKLKYITSRGNWYFKSWKGNIAKSGGIVTNIGIHLFDMLIWIVGKPTSFDIYHATETRVRGKLNFKNISVDWFLSVDRNDLPRMNKKNKINFFRQLSFNNKEIEFSNYFDDLHDKSYKKIFKNEGYLLQEAYESIKLCHSIKKMIKYKYDT